MPLTLDDASGLAQVDASNMLGQMAALPQQLLASLSKEVDIEKGYRKVCLCGLGGSAMGADVLCDHLVGTTDTMVSVVRDVRLPGWVDEETLTILLSYSGNTRETLAMHAEAQRRGTRIAVITSGGRLLQLSEANGESIVRVPPGLQPRAALGHLLGSAAIVLESVGIAPVATDLKRMVPSLEEDVRSCTALTLTEDNPGKKIAIGMAGTLPFIYSSRNVRSAGRRWQTQINENSKMLCLYGELPEADHNQIVGWVDGAKDGKNRPVFLRASSDRGMMVEIVKATISIFEDFGLDPLIVDLKGETSLESVMRGIVLGDHVSFYLAMLQDIDPMPVSSISELKKRLG